MLVGMHFSCMLVHIIQTFIILVKIQNTFFFFLNLFYCTRNPENHPEYLNDMISVNTTT